MIITTISKLEATHAAFGIIVGLTSRNTVSPVEWRWGVYTDRKGDTIYGWIIDHSGAPALPITNPDYPVQVIEPLHH